MVHRQRTGAQVGNAEQRREGMRMAIHRRRALRSQREARPLAGETLEPRLVLAAVAGERIYYDYLDEAGNLAGGWIVADPTNPYHVDLASGFGSLAQGPAMIGPLASQPAPPPYASSTVVDNGATDNRIDIVFVGDGYTENELEDYAADVDRIIPEFFSKSPLQEYSPFFNVHRVDVISAESGVDNDPTQGIDRDTALGMHFFCSNTERLLCVNVSAARNAANDAPAVDQILAIGNTSKYGGAGYWTSNLATFSSSNRSAVEIGIHEFGHSFANLADEYATGGPTEYVGSEPAEPNVSTRTADQLEAARSKWYRWLDLEEVDTFEGAKYSQQGIYRPTVNSIMRTLGQDFGPVNSEQLIYQIYRQVNPIDSATPAGSYDQDQLFQIEVVQPLSHQLDVTWLLNGEPIAGATAAEFNPSAWDLPEGTHELTVEVVDPTDMVRDERIRERFMSDSRSWNLTVTAPVHPGRVVGRSLAYLGTHHPADDGSLASVLIPNPDELEPDSCNSEISCGKQALLPGEPAGPINYVTHTAGITGVVVEIEAAPEPIGRADLSFRVGNSPDLGTWTAAPEPISWTWVPGVSDEIDRLVVRWEAGAITNTWLEVTVLANERTGLATPDVHYWGHQLGQVDASSDAERVVVDETDFAKLVAHAQPFLETADLLNPYDLNRDGLVDGSDAAIVRDAATAADDGLWLWNPEEVPVATPQVSVTDPQVVFAVRAAVQPAAVQPLSPDRSHERHVARDLAERQAQELAALRLLITRWLDDLEQREKLGAPVANAVDRLFALADGMEYGGVCDGCTATRGDSRGERGY